MQDKPPPPRKKRIRRSTEEIIERLINAAVVEFEEKGYTGATTAAIARRAGVTEALLFNHFGTKAQLFQDTIFKPLSRVFEDFLARWPAIPGDDVSRQAGSRAYIRELQEFMSNHSRMLLTLVYAQSYQPPGIDGLAQVEGLQDFFERSADMARTNLGQHYRIDPHDMARISFISIMACMLFKDWVFPDGHLRGDEIRNAIVDFVMDGLNGNFRPDGSRQQRA